MNLAWHDAGEEPPIRTWETLYWAVTQSLNGQPGKPKIVSYRTIWSAYGEGELICWAGPVVPPQGHERFSGVSQPPTSGSEE